MGNLPCEGCKGLCCGPVPITEKELRNIKKKLKSMPTKMRLELKINNVLWALVFLRFTKGSMWHPCRTTRNL